MKNLKIQTTPGHCGIYNLANALRDDDVLVFADMDEFVPCGDGEVNKILKKLGYTLRLEQVITALNFKAQIPEDFFKSTVSDFIQCNEKSGLEHPLTVLILYVQVGETEEDLHATTLMLYQNLMFYSDPRNESFEQITSFDSLFSKFSYLNAVKSFQREEGDGYVIFDAQDCGILEELI